MSVGKHAANEVIEQAWTDGSDEPWTGTIPTGPGIWYSSANPPQPPVDSNWPAVRPWLMSSASQFRAPSPPAFGSAEFLASLAEVRHFSDTRTPAQAAIAVFWADGAGTPTPPGHWNQIAAEHITEYALDELHAARVLMYMNIAIMDAGIACWDSKFTYWVIRPSQADPGITLAVGLPNFPAYTSGHSTFSAAGAKVLSHFFPQDAAQLIGMAEEAGMSRIYGGIHYDFDNIEGRKQGFAVAGLAIARAQAEAAGGF
jgi:membrane-associated phospholipid phosphatase